MRYLLSFGSLIDGALLGRYDSGWASGCGTRRGIGPADSGGTATGPVSGRTGPALRDVSSEQHGASAGPRCLPKIDCHEKLAAQPQTRPRLAATARDAK